MTDWAALLWPATAASDALRALCTTSGLTSDKGSDTHHLSYGVQPEPSERQVAAVLERTASALGVELLPTSIACTELERGMARFAPALIRLTTEASDTASCVTGYLALLALERRDALLLSSRGAQVRISAIQLFSALSARLSAQPRRLVEHWLECARIPSRRRARAQRQLLAMMLGDRAVDGIWLLRRDPGTSFRKQLAPAGVPRHVAQYLLATLFDMAFTMLAWWWLARAALLDERDASWLLAWILCAVSALPFRMLGSWSGGRAGIALSTVLKRRLLSGALRVDPELVRARGSGGLLAMVSESEAIERAGLDGTFAAVAALIQLAGAALALGFGASAAWHVTLLLASCVVVAGWAWRTASRLAGWTERRFDLSQMFVERVQGQRTRLVQDLPERWHDAEDEALADYANAARALDGTRHGLANLPPRAWLGLGMLGLVPALWSQPTAAALALSVGGVLQAHRAFATLCQSLDALLVAFVAWRSVGPLFRAAEHSSTPSLLPLPATSPNDSAVDDLEPSALELRAVNFQYGPGQRPTLQDCSLQLRRGERWLLEGASGSGKSTLAAIATGLHSPSTGRVLLNGFDHSLLGPRGLRACIASAPQFHQNHLLCAPLSFNLLMGRTWPASEADLEAAREVCCALGLGPLLARMPSGIHQVVGETGWQLSHGERSRVFLARALLQQAPVTILDESFGALDPETLQRCLSVARERATTLLVIAHP